MKKFLMGVLSTIMALTLVSGASAEYEGYIIEGINVKVNNKVIDFPDKKPYMVYTYQRVMIPVRFVSEALGAKVEWDVNTKTVKMIRSGKTITMKLGEKQALINGERYLFESPAVMKDNRVFVPLRFVSEIFGSKVEYLAKEKTALITSGELQPIKDVVGASIPVENNNPYFKAFHNSLKIKNGIFTFTAPTSTKKYNLQVSIRTKDGVSKVYSNGGTYSIPAKDMDGMHFLAIDIYAKKTLASISYSFPNLIPTDLSKERR